MQEFQIVVRTMRWENVTSDAELADIEHTIQQIKELLND